MQKKKKKKKENSINTIFDVVLKENESVFVVLLSILRFRF